MSNVIFIDPRGITPTEWCDRMTPQLVQFGPIPRLTRDEEWQDWGEQVIQLAGIDVKNVPEPDTFKSFEDWAIWFGDSFRN